MRSCCRLPLSVCCAYPRRRKYGRSLSRSLFGTKDDKSALKAKFWKCGGKYGCVWKSLVRGDSDEEEGGSAGAQTVRVGVGPTSVQAFLRYLELPPRILNVAAVASVGFY